MPGKGWLEMEITMDLTAAIRLVRLHDLALLTATRESDTAQGITDRTNESVCGTVRDLLSELTGDEITESNISAARA